MPNAERNWYSDGQKINSVSMPPTPKKVKNSPGYNPKDRIRKHLKRKSSSRCIAPDLENSISHPPDWATATVSCPSTFNETPSSVVKRSRLSGESSVSFALDFDDSNACDGTGLSESILSPLVNSFQSTSARTPRQVHNFNRFFSLDMSSDGRPSMPLDFSHFNASKLQESEQTEHESLPKDARLGCKLRIVSKTPFPCVPAVRSATTEVNIHTSGLERFNGIQLALGSGRIHETSSDPLTYLEAACVYFQFPYFPWLSMFPRCETFLKNCPELGPNLLPNTATDAVNRQWVGCFEQLFSTWKKGNRKEFYVACPNFTVLFTKNVDETEPTEDSASCFQTRCGMKHLAIMSQTTSSLREFLKTEGVEFEICAQKKTKKPPTNFVNFKVDENSVSNDTNTSAPPEENKENNTNEEEFVSPKKRTDDVWLNDIGISPNNAAKLKKKLFRKAKSSTTSLKKLDNEENELIASIVGSSVQTLYNILQTSKIVRPIAGVHANLPPTLIAAQPFVFSHMLSLKKSSSVIKREKDSDYVVELSGGPVMPQHVEMAYEFVKSCNLGEATIRVTERQTNQGLNNYLDECCDWNLLKLEHGKIYAQT
ncbi:hypothetical protein WR25_17922 [Diploscapter pachys]|uniref:Uncharacterized protein n=1 Tax=Diploscapter pachys TaxID=2018661 RepID=A0A2A2KEP1_9BILA|nr:hypothetical protein WR25_17922 [Diploscapter pachys]